MKGIKFPCTGSLWSTSGNEQTLGEMLEVMGKGAE